MLHKTGLNSETRSLLVSNYNKHLLEDDRHKETIRTLKDLKDVIIDVAGFNAENFAHVSKDGYVPYGSEYYQELK